MKLCECLYASQENGKKMVRRWETKEKEIFGRVMSDDPNENKLFWEELRKIKNQNKNTCANIKDMNGGVLVNDEKIF